MLGCVVDIADLSVFTVLYWSPVSNCSAKIEEHYPKVLKWDYSFVQHTSDATYARLNCKRNWCYLSRTARGALQPSLKSLASRNIA